MSEEPDTIDQNSIAWPVHIGPSTNSRGHQFGTLLERGLDADGNPIYGYDLDEKHVRIDILHERTDGSMIAAELRITADSGQAADEHGVLREDNDVEVQYIERPVEQSAEHGPISDVNAEPVFSILATLHPDGSGHIQSGVGFSHNHISVVAHAKDDLFKSLHDLIRETMEDQKITLEEYSRIVRHLHAVHNAKAG